MKQKLSKRNTYTPTDSSLVRSNCGLKLNKVERPSALSLKTLDNNPEENIVFSHTRRSLKALVCVVSKDNKPLMPCSYAKSKRMVKSGKAKVIKRFPFITIKLNFECENITQEVTLGLDTGYENVGISVRTEKKELVSLNVKLRTDVSKKLEEKKMYRRNRRSKLIYREPRFLNRGTPLGWLAPSVKHKLDSHLRLVSLICKYIPISNIKIEVANFDIQKINNPDIEGEEYQQGSLLGYENVKSYLITREQGLCQLCSKPSVKGNSFKVHHIIERSKGGTDKPDNLALLHEKCHKKLHAKGLKLKKNKQFKAETFMASVRWALINKLKEILPVTVTYGYLTKMKRNELNLEKSHSTDAFVISGGDNQVRCLERTWYQKRRNNRTLQLNRKGFKASVRRSRYLIQNHDDIWIGKEMFRAKGCHNKGTRVMYIDKEGKSKSIAIDKVTKYYNFGGFYA